MDSDSIPLSNKNNIDNSISVLKNQYVSLLTAMGFENADAVFFTDYRLVKLKELKYLNPDKLKMEMQSDNMSDCAILTYMISDLKNAIKLRKSINLLNILSLQR